MWISSIVNCYGDKNWLQVHIKHVHISYVFCGRERSHTVKTALPLSDWVPDRYHIRSADCHRETQKKE